MSQRIVVTGDGGLRGTIDSSPAAVAALDATTDVLLEDGTTITVPSSRLARKADGSYMLRQENVRVPVLDEQLDVTKRSVVTGTVRIEKTIHEREEVVDEPLRSETFEVERVPVNRVIDSIVEIRQVGDTTIYPIVEEVLVVTKQLILREELHVTKRVAEVHKPQTVTLRREEVVVERRSADAADPAE